MSDRIEYSTQGTWPAISCPGCGGSWLHHDGVDIYERQEDDETGLHLSVHGVDINGDKLPHGSVTLDQSMDGNPSSRRQGIQIWMWCEDCSCISCLEIVQHKGETHVQIRQSGRRT